MIPGTPTQADLFADPDPTQVIELRQEVIMAYERCRAA
jgi:hypothetical protein